MDFIPNPHQKELIDTIKKSKHPIVIERGRSTGHNPFYIGVDMGKKGGDKTAITVVKKRRGGHGDIIFMDEISNWPTYKWHRNPIQWYKWRKIQKGIMKRINENSK